MAKIIVQNTQITVIRQNEDDYISLTDMLKAKDGEFFFSNWLRNRNTIEFLGIWERLMNPNFNCAEFDIIKSQAGLNRFRLSAKEWTEKTNAIGIISKAGRYGGTYAHKDIAFEFAMWISPEFKVYLIREFQRLKDEEQQNPIPETIRPMLPNRMTGSWITLPTDALRIYFNLCIIKYFLNIISPNNDMKAKVDALLAAYPSIDVTAMGFPRRWESEPLWQ